MNIIGAKREAITLLSILVATHISQVTSVVIPAIVRQRSAINLGSIDTTANNLATSRTLVNDLEEKFAVSIVPSIKAHTLIYNEPWSRSRYDRIRILPFAADSNTGLHEIRRRSGVAEEVITSLAVDWLTGNIYAAVEQTASLQNPTRIEVCPPPRKTTDGALVDGADCAVILHGGLEGLHSLVVDPIDGYMYWLNRIRGRIERAWMDGRHLDHAPYHDAPSPTLSADESGKLSTLSFALTLDAVGRRLYFIRAIVGRPNANSVKDESPDQEIVACRLYDRTSCRVVVRTNGASGLAPFQNLLFWTTAGAKRPDSLLVKYCELANCEEKTFAVENSVDVESLALLDAAIQPERQNPNPCTVANGGCSHVCLLTPGAPWRQCACPIGIQLANDGATCETAADGAPLHALFVASIGGLFYVSLDTDDRVVRAVLPVDAAASGSLKKSVDQMTSTVLAVDYDSTTRHVYWLVKAGAAAAEIRRCRLNGSDYSKVLIDTDVDINSFAVDWRAGNLLWTDATNNRIEIMSLQSGHRRTLLADQLLGPQNLHVDDVQRRVYFVNFYASDSPYLESVAMDGSQRTLSIKFASTATRLNDVVIVSKENAVYWTDSERSQILKSRLDAPDVLPEVVMNDLRSAPNSIAKLESRIFYNTLGARFVTELRVSADGRAIGALPTDFSDAEIYGQTSLKAIQLADVDGDMPRPCAAHSCDQICVQTGSSARKCLCADGFESDGEDERKCRRPDEFIVVADVDGLWRTSADGRGRSSHLEYFAASPSAVSTIGGHDKDGNLYWSAGAKNKSNFALLRADLERRHAHIYSDSPAFGKVVGLAVDSTLSGNLFVCDAAYRRVEVISSRNPSLRRALFWSDVSTPNLLAIHSTRHALFFTVTHPNATVNICALRYDAPELLGDGVSPLRTLVADAGNVTALAVDTVGERLFWATFTASSDSDVSDKATANGVGAILSVTIDDALLSSSLPLPKRHSNNINTWIRTRFLSPASMVVGAGGRTLYLINNGRSGPWSSIDTLDVSATAPALPNSVSSARQTLRTLHTVPALGNRTLTHIHIVSSTQLLGDDTSKLLDCHDRRRGGEALDCICIPQATAARLQCVCSDQMHRDERSGICKPPDDFILLGAADRFVRFAVDTSASQRIASSVQPVVVMAVERPLAVAADMISPQRRIYWIDGDGQLRSGAATDDVLTSKHVADDDEELHVADCARFFDVYVDVFSRHLLASCVRQQTDDFGFVHIWRIRDNQNEASTLMYLGVIVDGFKSSRRILPKEIIVSSSLGAFFYVDHSARFDSPAIFNCRLDGRQCVFVASTGLSANERVILRFFGTRIFYFASGGLWSRQIATVNTEMQRRLSVESLNDVRNHLTWETDADRRRIRDIVVIDESLALVVVDAFEDERSGRVLELNLRPTTFKYAPRHLSSLANASLPLAAAGLDAGRMFAATISLGSALRADVSTLLHSRCSHISAPTTAMRRALSLADRKKSSKDESETDDDDDEDENLNGFDFSARGNIECLCPSGFSVSTTDHNRCEPNAVCAPWQFACADGRHCVHFAQRCDRRVDCADSSDEHPTTCPFHFSPDFSPERAVSSNATDHWMCDDGATVIRKYLLCDGSTDCRDASDETHCRCRAPSEHFDCAAWQYRHYHEPLRTDDDCVLRAMLCDGRDHCRYGADERAQLCAALSSTAFILPMMFRDHKLVVGGLAAAVLLLLLVVCCICVICMRRTKSDKKRDSAAVKRSNRGASAPLINGQQFETTAMINRSSSTYHCVLDPVATRNTIGQVIDNSALYAAGYALTDFSGAVGSWPYSAAQTVTHRESSRISQFSQTAGPFCRCARCVELEAALTPHSTANLYADGRQQQCLRSSRRGRSQREKFSPAYDACNLQPASGYGGNASQATTQGVFSSVLLPVPIEPCLFAPPTQPNAAVFFAPPPSAASESTYGVARIVPTASAGLLSLTRHDHQQPPPVASSTTTTTLNLQSGRGEKRGRLKVRMPPRGRRQRIRSRLARNRKTIVHNLSDEFIPSPPIAQSIGGASERQATPTF